MSFISTYIGGALVAGAATVARYCMQKRDANKDFGSSGFYHGTTEERWLPKEGDTFQVKDHLFFANKKEAKEFAQQGVSLYRPVTSFKTETGHPIVVKLVPVNPKEAEYRKGVTGCNYFVNKTALKVDKISKVSTLSSEEKRRTEEQRMELFNVLNTEVGG